ncbi:MAG: hypothetical protein A2663_02110 [Candidatus Buchananbacteria bacterium RIFCSPHIGHO2_01_FULL_46_12]|uniref:DUF86 domain-containing protein n=1 Tax=Candidatus Buchananbacteria bacterium RIFCSPHIGHO2_01_FULL_46_12 TaxID=1797536 RepID=A0A1G1Y546_9BACT|nr:MAG: hypothetical protein A2663_02110 [Candidatus Buchananbacteria bacterium RIFCSPHIGHO2_01_FULL_46_12]
MTNANVLENKISAVKKYLKILERYQKLSAQEIARNIDLKGALERYLYLAVQSAIDLAEMAVANNKLRKPSTMSESFEILGEEKIISSALQEKLVKMVGFRNVMAHDYEAVDEGIVFDVLQNRLADIRKFLKIIEKI